MSEHDVKGVFVNAKIPDGKLVVVTPPEQWVRMGPCSSRSHVDS